MTQVRSSIPNFLGGKSTLPSVSRESTEVAEAKNVLFSREDGVYRRPGAEIIYRLLNRGVDTFVSKNDTRPEGIGENLIRYQRAMWCFPASATRAQILLLGHGNWETFFIDLKTNDLLRDKDGVAIDFDDNPVPLQSYHGTSEYLRFRDRRGEPLTWAQVLDENGPQPRPQQVFRVTKSEGRIWILNRTAPVALGNARAPENAGKSGFHQNHWMIVFYALTSGQEVRMAMTFQFDGAKYGQEFSLGSDGVETIAERFVAAWAENPENTEPKLLPTDFRTKPTDAIRSQFDVRARRQTATIRTLSTDITGLDFKFLNVAARPVSDAAGDKALAGLPTIESLPATAPRDWIVEVQGSSVSQVDNAWYRFRVGDQAP